MLIIVKFENSDICEAELHFRCGSALNNDAGIRSSGEVVEKN
jgi:hypothetical protein